MDYEKDCEERLRKYARTEETLAVLNKRLDKITMHGRPGDLKAIDFSKIGHCSMTSDAMQDLVEARHIMNQIHKVKDEKAIIDSVLDKVKKNNKEDMKFIDFRYLQGNPMERVNELLGYSSPKVVYKIKDRALKNFTLYYWGE